MKKFYKFIVIGLLITVSHGDTHGASNMEQRLSDARNSIQRLIAELQSLRQCIPAGTCSKSQYNRIKMLGTAIVAIVGALLLARAGRSYKRTMTQKEIDTYVEAKMQTAGISLDTRINQNAARDYNYLRAAVTMSRDQFENYNRQQEGLSNNVRSLAKQIRWERWQESTKMPLFQELYQEEGGERSAPEQGAMPEPYPLPDIGGVSVGPPPSNDV